MSVKPESKVQARAIVELIVTVELPDRWGPDCQIDQVYRQAEKGAIDAVRSLAVAGDRAEFISKVEAIKVRAVLAERAS